MMVKFDPPDDWKECRPGTPCRLCKSYNMWFRTYQASDGSVEDDELQCRDCGETWWVDGIDA